MSRPMVDLLREARRHLELHDQEYDHVTPPDFMAALDGALAANPAADMTMKPDPAKAAGPRWGDVGVHVSASRGLRVVAVASDAPVGLRGDPVTPAQVEPQAAYEPHIFRLVFCGRCDAMADEGGIGRSCTCKGRVPIDVAMAEIASRLQEIDPDIYAQAVAGDARVEACSDGDDAWAWWVTMDLEADENPGEEVLGTLYITPERGAR